MTIEKLPIDLLVPYARNSRTHNDAQVAQIAASIREFGFTNPVLIDEKSSIIAGHGRVLAARKIGLGEIPCIRLSHLSDSQKRAYVIADNKLALNAGWDDEMLRLELADLKAADFDLSLVGFDKDELAEILQMDDANPDADAEPQIDKADELREKWGVETGQLWQLGEHRIICGDCTSEPVVDKLMGSDQADCVFTSPPYAVGVDYGETYTDNIENLRCMLPKLSVIWLKIVKPGGFAVINFGDIITGQKIVGSDTPCEYPMALEYWPVFRKDGWSLWSRRIWCKPGAGTGSMQCISSNRAATNWEHIWTWKKPGPAMFTSQTTGDYPSQNGWIDSTGTEKMAYGLKDHGAGMPPYPAKYSVSNHSMVGGIVVESFSGTGTTIVACEQLGRKCRAFEINPAYVAVALQRWADATGGEPRKL